MPLGIDLKNGDFTIFSKLGLEIAYLYFQFPLMVLIMAPAIQGLKTEWREASENMGASTYQYWRHIALPILMPTLLGTMILLFGNAFGAQATAYTLTGEINIVTLLVTRQINGDVLNNINLGYAVAMGMVGVMGDHDPGLPVAPAPGGAVAAMRRTRFAWWVVFVIAALYFFVPLVATFIFSLGNPLGNGAPPPSLEAYGTILASPDFWGSLTYSFIAGIVTIIVSIGLLMPTAYWVRLKVPRARPVIEFITLLPFVIPPIILVFGLISTFSQGPVPLTHTDMGSNVLLVAAYTVLSFPYMYRAIDTGLQATDIRSLTEAAQSLGAGWTRIILQVILPNLRVALLSGAFLTLAIVVGEFTIASFLARPAFGPYLQLLGQNAAYEPAAVTIISFGLTWLAMIMIAFIGRGGRTRVAVTGAR